LTQPARIAAYAAALAVREVREQSAAVPEQAILASSKTVDMPTAAAEVDHQPEFDNAGDALSMDAGD
jgi:hypothetical protein